MISSAQIIYSKLCEVYPDAMQSITSLSYNSDGDIQFILSDELGFNFDTVYNFSECHPEGRKEKSPDALFIVDEILYFIEFKEGKTKKDDIRMKIHEGITTLFCFVLKYLPNINRDDFLKLDIRYAVVMRDFRAKGRAGFLQDLEASSNKFNLRNLEGFLIKKTAIKDEPCSILALLSKVTTGRINSIKIKSRDNTINEFVI